MVWRLIIYGIALTVLLFGFTAVTAIIAGFIELATSGGDPTSVEQMANSPIVLAASAIAALPGVLLATWLVGRFIDRRKVLTDFGLRLDGSWWLDLGFGLALGAVLMALIFLVELAFGWVTVTDTLTGYQGFSFPVAFTGQLIVFLCVGIYEEVLSRGYQFVNFAEGFSGLGRVPAIWLAFALSSVIFGVLHASNPNATVISTFNIVLAGFMLGMGMLLTGKLAVPIGLHITWNFFQGAVFGFPVSGLGTVGSVIAVEQGGPTLITGGPFGPEAGLIGVAAMAVGIGLTLAYVKLRYGQVGLHMALAEPTLRARTEAQ